MRHVTEVTATSISRRAIGKVQASAVLVSHATWARLDDQKVLRREANIPADLAQEDREMSRPACIGTMVARSPGSRNCLWEPRCRTSLEARDEDRRRTHSGDANRLCSDELCFQKRLPILQEHGDHLSEVGLQLLHGCALTVRPRKPGMCPTRKPVSVSRSTSAVYVRTLTPSAQRFDEKVRMVRDAG